MDLSAILPSGFYAVNYGDGQTLELVWGVADIHSVKHFIVQRYDVYTKKWVPYDGFHGLLSRADGDGTLPPQRVVVTIDEDGTHSFRIKATSFEDKSTDWVSTTIDVKADSQVGPNHIYFVQNGLEITHKADNVFTVSEGVAFVGGVRHALTSATNFRVDAEPGETYLVCIDIAGEIVVTTGSTVENGIRIAEIAYATNGTFTIRDTRWLWAPENLQVEWDKTNFKSLSMNVTWNPVNERNVAGYLLYRGSREDNLAVIASIEPDTTEYIDNRGLQNGTTYYYAVGVIDWNSNRSPRTTPPVSAEAGSIDPPAQPEIDDVRAGWNSVDGAYIEIKWHPNPPEDHVKEYLIWQHSNYDDDTPVYIGRNIKDATGNIPTVFRAKHLENGQRYYFSVIAVNELDVQSPRSQIVSEIAGNTKKPKAPEWDDPALESGGTQDEVWVDLKWLPVVLNEDGSQNDGIVKYIVYSKGPTTDYGYAGEVTADTNTIRLRYDNVFRGQVLTYSIKAQDMWGNVSEYSDDKSIRLGGRGDIEAPVLSEPMNIGISGSLKVRLEWSRVDGATQYRVFRGRTGGNLVPVETVFDSGEGEYGDWVDSTVVSGVTYLYAVKAIDENYNESPFSNIEDILVESSTVYPNDPPVITGAGTEIDGPVIRNWITFTIADDETIKGVRIYVSDDDRDYVGLGWVANTGEESYTYIHSGVENGKQYYYALTTVDYDGNETPILGIPITEDPSRESVLAGDTRMPKTPENFTLAPWWNEGVAGIEIGFDHVDELEDESELVNLRGYRIYRSTNGIRFSLLDEITENYYLDTNLVNGYTYWYYVTCVNQIGVESLPTEIESERAGKTVGPNAPTGLKVSKEYDSNRNVVITLSWDEVNDAVRYEVSKSINGTHYKVLGYTEDTEFSDTLAYLEKAYYRVRGIDEFENHGEFALTGEIDTVRQKVIDPINIVDTTYTQQPANKYAVKLDWSSYVIAEPEYFSEFRIYTSNTADVSNAVVMDTVVDQEVMTYSMDNLYLGQDYWLGITCRDIFGNESDVVLQKIHMSDDVAPAEVINFTARATEIGITLEWEPPITDTKGDPLVDLAGYEIYADTSPLGDTVDPSKRLTSTTANSYFHQPGGNQTWYYKVRAYDTSRNMGPFSEEREATSKGLDGSSFNTEKPPVVSGLRPASPASGVTLSADNDTEDVWISFEWDASTSPVLDYYNIYLDGEYFAQTKGTSFVARHLLGGKEYVVTVTAVDKNRNESDHQAPGISITAKGDKKTIAPPDVSNAKIIQYFRGLSLSWDPSPATHVDYYEVEYCMFEDENSRPDASTNWIPLTKSKFTYVVHGRIEYDLYFFYRLRTVDTFRNTSEWVMLSEDPSQPTRTGVEDVFYNSVTADHLQAESVLAKHLTAGSVKATHIDAEAIEARHLSAGAVRTEHLDVRISSRNLVSNSAFAMFDLNGNDMLDWSMVPDKSSKVTIFRSPADTPIGETSLQISSATDDTVVVYQKIDLKDAEEILSLSAYIYTDGVVDKGEDNAFIVDIVDSMTNPVRYNAPDGSEQYIKAVENTSWSLFKARFRVPHTDATSVYLRIMLKNTKGTARITGIMLESGDVHTEWYPKAGESYGARGSVQINSDGVIITDGRLKIHTDISNNDGVLINSDGIFAGSAKNNKYTMMTGSGFYSIGGEFVISTKAKAQVDDNDNSDSVLIDSSGLKAFDESGTATVEIKTTGDINIRGGKFSISTRDNDVAGLKMDSQGIRVYKSGIITPVVDIKESGSIEMVGEFSIKSSNSTSGARFEIDSSSFRAFNGQGVPSFKVNSSDGSVEIGSSLTVNSGGIGATTGSRFEILGKDSVDRMAGIYGYDSSGNVAYKLLRDGTALFNGSVTVQSATGGIRMTPEGLYGDGFTLIDGGILTVTKANIENVTITQGNVELNKDGMVVKGAKGISVQNANTEIVKIDGTGIHVKEGAGITVEGDGSIKIGTNATAITARGIDAGAINVGQLVLGTDSPSIVVKRGTKDIVTIDDDGIVIEDGHFLVKDSQGEALIKNGMVQARALEITQAGSNAIINGRGDFDLTSWDNKSTLVVSVISESNNAPAGVSGAKAFKIASDGYIRQQLQDVSSTEKYMLTCYVYVVRGSATIKVGSETLSTSGLDANQWHQVSLGPINVSKGTVVDITAGPNSDIYITDITLSLGVLKSGFIPHSSEVKSGKVSITDKMFKIETGADSSVVLDDTGLYRINGTSQERTFELSASGLSINLDKQGIRFNDTDGLYVNNGSKYVRISNGGIVANNFFTLVGEGEYVNIDATGVKIGPKNSPRVTLGKLSNGTFGLELKTAGGITAIRSDGTIDASALTVGTIDLKNDLKLKGAGGSVIIDKEGFRTVGAGGTQIKVGVDGKLVIGDNAITLSSEGLVAENFSIGPDGYAVFQSEEKDDNGNKIGEVVIDGTKVETRRMSGDTAIYATALTPQGLMHIINPNTPDAEISPYFRMSHVGSAHDGDTIELHGFTGTPKIIIMPTNLQTYRYRRRREVIEYDDDGNETNRYTEWAEPEMDQKIVVKPININQRDDGVWEFDIMCRLVAIGNDDNVRNQVSVYSNPNTWYETGYTEEIAMSMGMSVSFSFKRMYPNSWPGGVDFTFKYTVQYREEGKAWQTLGTYTAKRHYGTAWLGYNKWHNSSTTARYHSIPLSGAARYQMRVMMTDYGYNNKNWRISEPKLYVGYWDYSKEQVLNTGDVMYIALDGGLDESLE